MWHHPDGTAPAWEMPGILALFPDVGSGELPDYYRPYPEFSRKTEREPVHPQVVLENGPDSLHFRYVHGATVTPQMLDYRASEHAWTFLTGWPDARSDDPEKMALKIHAHMFGLGGSISAFEGSSKHRLIFATTPPVDDESSDLFYSIWWPRNPPGDDDVPPADVRDRVERQFLVTVWEDLSIWRHQKYVEHPPLSPKDSEPYLSLRKWLSSSTTSRRSTPPSDPPRGCRSRPSASDQRPVQRGSRRSKKASTPSLMSADAVIVSFARAVISQRGCRRRGKRIHRSETFAYRGQEEAQILSAVARAAWSAPPVAVTSLTTPRS